jgi:hypothetical protein
LVGITSLAGTPFFHKRGAGCIKKRAGAPFFPQKGGQCPLFEGKRGFPPKKLYQNVPTEISFGIGMVNTKKYRPIPTGKYRFATTLVTKDVIGLPLGSIMVIQLLKC